jgi:hypothetical protein
MGTKGPVFIRALDILRSLGIGILEVQLPEEREVWAKGRLQIYTYIYIHTVRVRKQSMVVLNRLCVGACNLWPNLNVYLFLALTITSVAVSTAVIRLTYTCIDYVLRLSTTR